GDNTSSTVVTTVNNVAPSALALTSSAATINEGSSVNVSGMFTDPGTADSHTVVIAWGDGSTSTVNLGAGTLGFGATGHAYADNGVYTATVTVTDKDGDNTSS